MKFIGKKNKVIKLLLICIILLIILLTLILMLQYFNSKEFARKKYGYENMGVYKDPNVQITGSLLYKNADVFMEFKGKLSTSKMTKKLKEIFINQIPQIMQDIKDYEDDEIASYFETNKNEIYSKIRINNFESFCNMINEFKIQADLFDDYKSCEFSKNSESIDIEMVYKSDEKVHCKLYGDSVDTFVLEF